jgi:endonuclease/exonuclease/phosphatase family metal-dependent hydrolase
MRADRSLMNRLKFLAAYLAAAGALMAAPAGPPSSSHSLRVMTYNIRLDLASDGPNAWTNRRSRVSAQVHWLRPDLFGLQEVLPNQMAELAADLPQYRLFGKGRDPGGTGEASPIGFDRNRFEFLAGGTFWLSPTPEVSSRAWDAALPRVATWVRLRIRDSHPESRTELLAVNTHWDHIGLLARRKSAGLLADWISANARPCDHVMLVGDFNSDIDSAQMRSLTRSREANGHRSLRDARASSRTPPFGPAGTFNAFQPAPVARGAIDHILVGAGVEVERFAVISLVIEGRVPSDHFPVLADLALRPCSRTG